MKQLLIVTGPQGSGNHMWSKVLAHTPGVQGWAELTEEYWISHQYEPMHDLWEDPKLFFTTEFEHEYYVTSISCPYTHSNPKLAEGDGGFTPNYRAFIECAKLAGFNVTLAIIGRDANILEYQQTRVRGQYTTPWFMEKAMPILSQYNPHFISTELLYLYRGYYLKQLSQILNFPIKIEDADLDEILQDNTNRKYLKAVDGYWLDNHMQQLFNQKQQNK